MNCNNLHVLTCCHEYKSVVYSIEKEERVIEMLYDEHVVPFVCQYVYVCEHDDLHVNMTCGITGT